MKTVTYLFGAGASYQSMPLVVNFSKRFEIYIKFLDSLSPSIEVKSLIKQSQKFLVHLKSHLSFDTFFKKLYHLQNEDIIKYKKVLNLYFSFEHYINIYEENLLTIDLRRENKIGVIDKRYDALIAALLKPQKKAEFYAKLNFITWNYDLNLLTAICNFLTTDYSIKETIKLAKHDGRLVNFGDSVNLAFMNGVFLNNEFDHTRIYTFNELRSMFQEISKKVFEYNEYLDENANRISFAWESQGDTDQALNQFQNQVVEMVKKSDTIVIMGYSFPLYNRAIDKKYFNAEILTGKQVYIQDLNYEARTSQFVDYFNLGGLLKLKSLAPGKKCDIIPVVDKECNSFYVPNDII